MSSKKQMLEVISKFAPQFTVKKTATKVTVYSDKECKNKIGVGKDYLGSITSAFNTANHFNTLWKTSLAGRYFPNSTIQLKGNKWFCFDGETQMAPAADHFLNINTWDYENKNYFEKRGKQRVIGLTLVEAPIKLS